MSEQTLAYTLKLLEEKDATIAALREEVAEVKKRYQLSVYAEETERKARVNMTSDNAALRARAEQAEAELAAERGKVERVRAWVDINEKTFPNGILCFAERIREILE